MTPIVLNDGYMYVVLANAQVLKEFPQLAAIKDRVRQTPGGGGCGSCSAGRQRGAQYQQARNYIIALPDDQLAKLKSMLGLPAERQFLAYPIVNGRTQRTVR